jgi:hypothetical protein
MSDAPRAARLGLLALTFFRESHRRNLQNERLTTAISILYYTKQISPETEGASTTALWLEIVFGLFSLLGIGHVYTGRIWMGIALLIAWWVYDVIAITLSFFTLGFASCLFLPIYIAVPIILEFRLAHIETNSGKGDW